MTTSTASDGPTSSGTYLLGQNLTIRASARLMLAAASAVFVLALAEFPAAIDLVDYRAILGARTADSIVSGTVADPELIHIRRPHLSLKGNARGGQYAHKYQIPTSDMGFYQWDVKYDWNGFRNDVDLKRADVAVIGDSFVEGLTVLNSELSTSLLATWRREVVANLGQGGYGPLQELVVLRRYALPLHPHTVVWMFFEGNDLQDVVDYRRAKQIQLNSWHAFSQRSFTRNSVHQVKNLWFAPAKPLGITRSAFFQTSDGRESTIYFGNPSGTLSAQDVSALGETISTLADAYKLCVTQRVRFIFVFAPTKFRVFRSYCRFPQQSECRNWSANDLPERLRQAAASISPDIGYVDLTPNLVAAVRRGELPYYPDDAHWSPVGHKIVAETIKRVLVAHYSRFDDPRCTGRVMTTSLPKKRLLLASQQTAPSPLYSSNSAVLKRRLPCFGFSRSFSFQDFAASCTK